MFRNVKFTDTRAVSPELKIIVRNTYNAQAHLLKVMFCFVSLLLLLFCMCIFYFVCFIGGKGLVLSS